MSKITQTKREKRAADPTYKPKIEGRWCYVFDVECEEATNCDNRCGRFNPTIAEIRRKRNEIR